MSIRTPQHWGGRVVDQDAPLTEYTGRRIIEALGADPDGASPLVGTAFNRGANTLGQGQIALSTTPTLAVAARARRRSATVRNNDPAISIYVGGSTVTASGATGGILVKAGDAIPIDTTAAIWAVSASGTPLLSWLETYDV